ncbi:MAG: hypothetical protein ACRC1K_10680, partial [Planctomycetia bacterium]
GKFWSQLVRWSMRGGESENLSVSTLEKDGVVTVVVNAIDKTQEFLNFLRLNGKLVQPDRTTVDLSFRQTEPGKYVAQFPAEQAGSYLMRLGYRQSGGGEGFVSTGLNISYPPEYRDLESRRDLLENLAGVTGGRMVEAKDVASTDFFLHEKTAVASMQDLWPELLLAALAFFALDVAVRRIAFDASDIRWAAAIVWSMLRRKPAPAATSPTMERLRARKAEVGQTLTRDRKFEAGDAPTVLPSPLAETAVEPPKPALAPPKKPAAGSLGGKVEAEPETYASRLLQAKKKAMEERKKTEE